MTKGKLIIIEAGKRNTGNAAWNNIRPPHLKLTEAQQAQLFADIDASGVQLAKAA